MQKPCYFLPQMTRQLDYIFAREASRADGWDRDTLIAMLRDVQKPVYGIVMFGEDDKPAGYLYFRRIPNSHSIAIIRADWEPKYKDVMLEHLTLEGLNRIRRKHASMYSTKEDEDWQAVAIALDENDASLAAEFSKRGWQGKGVLEDGKWIMFQGHEEMYHHYGETLRAMLADHYQPALIEEPGPDDKWQQVTLSRVDQVLAAILPRDPQRRAEIMKLLREGEEERELD